MMRLFLAAVAAAVISAVFGRVLDPLIPSVSSSITILLDPKITASLDAPVPTVSSKLRFDPTAGASRELWQWHLQKGAAMRCACLGSDQVAGEYMGDTRTPKSAASHFRGTQQEFDTWFWFSVGQEQGMGDLDDEYQIGSALDALGLSKTDKRDGGDNQAFGIQHKDPRGPDLENPGQYYMVVHEWYRATGGNFEFVVNTVGGAIFVSTVLNCEGEAEENWNIHPIETDWLPDLRSLSDILWNVWVRNNPNIRNIKNFFMLGVTNGQTQRLLATALFLRSAQLVTWPGFTFASDTIEGQVILGSPIGATFSFLLLQHKAELGNKYIDRITVFQADDGKSTKYTNANLIFHVADAPAVKREDYDASPGEDGVPDAGSTAAEEFNVDARTGKETVANPRAVEAGADAPSPDGNISDATPAIQDAGDAAPTLQRDVTNGSLTLGNVTDALSPMNIKGAIAAWTPPEIRLSDEEWVKFVGKGNSLLCGCQGSDMVAGVLIGDTRKPPSAASPWTSNYIEALDTWFWTEDPPGETDHSSCDMIDFQGVAKMVAALGISGRSKEHTPPGDIECFVVHHFKRGSGFSSGHQYYFVGGKAYLSTGAEYNFGVDTIGGVLYNFYVYSPITRATQLWYQGSRKPDISDLPAIRSLSDILWAYWNMDNLNLENIRYFIVLSITNDVTEGIMYRALADAKSTYKPWPGTEFSSESNHGKALIGSPNGAVFSWFLMQHKADLGNKYIYKVTVFGKDSGGQMGHNLCFHVKDTPTPPPDALI